MVLQFSMSVEVPKLELTRIDELFMMMQLSKTMEQSRNILSTILPSFFQFQQTISRSSFLLGITFSIIFFILFSLFMSFNQYFIFIKCSFLLILLEWLRVLFLDGEMFILKTWVHFERLNILVFMLFRSILFWSFLILRSLRYKYLYFL